MGETIKIPHRAQPLYTESDFEQAMERANGDKNLALQQEEARGCGFGFFYFSLLNDMLYSKQINRLRDLIKDCNQGLYISGGEKQLCDTVNAVEQGMRNRLAWPMQAYIRRKGYIDVWPYPGNAKGISVHGYEGEKKTETITVPFGFFNRPFTSKKESDKKIIIYRSPWEKKLYENGVPRPEELVKRDKRLKELRAVRKPTKRERTVSNMKMIGACAPLLLLAFFAAALVFWYLTGTEKPLKMLGTWAPAGSLMAKLMLPADLLLLFPAAFYPFLSAHPAVLWGSVAVLLVIGFFAMALLADAINAEWISNKQILAGIRATEEIERLEKDERYIQMQKEYEERVREDEAFAQYWIDEWKLACKQNKIVI